MTLQPMLLVREKNRRCDGCDFTGEVFIVAVGSKSLRLCNADMCRLERMRMRVQVESLDSLETR